MTGSFKLWATGAVGVGFLIAAVALGVAGQVPTAVGLGAAGVVIFVGLYFGPKLQAGDRSKP